MLKAGSKLQQPGNALAPSAGCSISVPEQRKEQEQGKVPLEHAGKNPFQAGLLLRAEQVFLYHSKQLL